MPVSFFFSLPLPPSVNSDKWIHNGRIIKKDTVRVWKKEAAYLLLHIPKQKIEVNWEVELTFQFYYVNTPRKYDCDNRLKPIFDALKERLGIDDSLLMKFTVTKQIVKGKEPHKVIGEIILRDDV